MIQPLKSRNLDYGQNGSKLKEIIEDRKKEAFLK